MNKKYFLLLIPLAIFVLTYLYAISLQGNPNITSVEQESKVFDKPILCSKNTNPFESLSVPTQITKIEEDYFIVDCYHNQILTSQSLDLPLAEWDVLTDAINRGHMIAGDGQVYLVDDTENNQVLVFEKIEDVFYITQFFSDIGTRPHCVIYDEDAEVFYVLSSMTGELYVFSRDADSSRIILDEIIAFPELNEHYIRSFSIIDKEIYLVSGNGFINVVSMKSWNIIESYPVPDELYGMIQIEKIGAYYYITVSTDINGNQDYATILRVKDLDDLVLGDYEEVYDQFVLGGTPYYLSEFDESFYLTEHRVNGIGVWKFDIENEQIINQEVLFQ